MRLKRKFASHFQGLLCLTCKFLEDKPTSQTYYLVLQSGFIANIVYFSKIVNFKNYFYLIYVILRAILIVLGLWAHYTCLSRNPGHIPLILGNSSSLTLSEAEIVELNSNFEFCRKCKSFRPIGSHHCKKCKKCILRMDHHCVWINNCVGKFNQKFFIQYILVILSMSIMDIVLVLTNVPDFIPMKDQKDRIGLYFLSRAIPYLMILLLTVATTFFLFTGIMFIDQMISLYHNKTHIDRLKNLKFKRIGFFRLLRTVFGTSVKEILLPINNKNQLPMGKELTVVEILSIIGTEEYELTEG